MLKEKKIHILREKLVTFIVIWKRFGPYLVVVGVETEDDVDTDDDVEALDDVDAEDDVEMLDEVEIDEDVETLDDVDTDDDVEALDDVDTDDDVETLDVVDAELDVDTLQRENSHYWITQQVSRLKLTQNTKTNSPSKIKHDMTCLAQYFEHWVDFKVYSEEITKG